MANGIDHWRFMHDPIHGDGGTGAELGGQLMMQMKIESTDEPALPLLDEAFERFRQCPACRGSACARRGINPCMAS